VSPAPLLRLARELAVAPIRFYRRFLSPLKPPMCRFEPTCSEYALVAVRVHGVVKGFLLGAWRLLRCQPLCEGGHDPVPPRGSWRRAAAEPREEDEGC
jgi:putative membrane protein insertion efficiency factor